MNDKIIEGKTKLILDAGDGTVLVQSKNDITAGDGLKHEVMADKAVYSTLTTCNVFALLEANSIRTHFIEQVDDTTFRARRVDMLYLELISRRIATGSYLKRYPFVADGREFDPLLIEFFEKDDKLSPPDAGDDTMNDPFLWFDFKQGRLVRFKPKRPIEAGFIDVQNLLDSRLSMVTPQLHAQLAALTAAVFLVLESAWASLEGVLYDFKIECGFDHETRELLVADVIDNDSWRLRFHGKQVDKQNFRDGTKSLDMIKLDYAEVAFATNEFV